MGAITDQDLTDMFDEMLDDCYPVVKIGESEFHPSTILKECDPISYRIGRNDYADSLVEDGYEVEGF